MTETFYRYTDAEGNFYYYNTQTQESFYEKPENVYIYDPDGKIIFDPTAEDNHHDVAPTENHDPPLQNEDAPIETNNPPKKSEVTFSPEIDPANNLGASARKDSKHKKKSHKSRRSMGVLETSDKKEKKHHEHIGKKKKIKSTPPGTHLVGNTLNDKTEIFCYTYTRDEFEQLSLQYQLISYAKDSFRPQKSGVLSRKVIPIQKVLEFQSSPIKQSLLQDLIPVQSKVAVNCFKLILSITDVTSLKGTLKDNIKLLLEMVVNNSSIIDEVFFQLAKQTGSCPITHSATKGWELFLTFASLLIPSSEVLPYLLGYCANSALEANPNSNLAALSFIRMQIRNSMGYSIKKAPTDQELDLYCNFSQLPPKQFNVSLYEIMWNQREKYPKLPFPYIEYVMIDQIIKKRGYQTTGLFRLPGNMRLVNELSTKVDTDISCLNDVNLHDVGSLLKMWFRNMTIPVVPFARNDDLFVSHRDHKDLDFVETLPKINRYTLMYLIGFLKEAASHSSATQMHDNNLAIVFGPNIVQAAENETDSSKLQAISSYANDFVLYLIQNWDTSEIYPLNPYFLEPA